MGQSLRSLSFNRKIRRLIQQVIKWALIRSSLRTYTGCASNSVFMIRKFSSISQRCLTIKFEKIDKKSAFLWAQKGFLLYSTVKLPEIHHLILQITILFFIIDRNAVQAYTYKQYLTSFRMSFFHSSRFREVFQINILQNRFVLGKAVRVKGKWSLKENFIFESIELPRRFMYNKRRNKCRKTK